MGSGRQQATPKAIYIANIIPIVEIDENQKKLMATPVDTKISTPRMMVPCFVCGKKRRVFSVIGIYLKFRA